MAEMNLKKQQIEYIGVGALVLVALLIGLTRFKKGDNNDEVFSRKEFNEKWAEVEVLEAKVPEEESGVAYLAGTGRVPFKSPLEEEAVSVEDESAILPEMKFQGMVWSSIRPQAIIDDKLYDVDDVIEVGLGETKSQVKIKDITRTGIRLRFKGKDFIVRPK
ncbi:MAG: hypothetical protein P9L93_07380 [Candidatus Gorgyraea atricola]|nr:hypothetical protein [Candidatus Gorgyraea atricola]